MARYFNASTNDLTYGSAAVVTAAPLTMACWHCPFVSGTLMAINNNTTAQQFALTSVSGASSARTTHTSVVFATSTFVQSASNFSHWLHNAAVFSSATARAAFTNGAYKATNSTSSIPTGLSKTMLGAFGASTPSLNGFLAEAGIWNVALTDGEIALLASGVYPYQIRPQSLVAYWPLTGTGIEIDANPFRQRRYDLTAVNTAPKIAPHPVMRNYPSLSTRLRRFGVSSGTGAGIFSGGILNSKIIAGVAA